MAAWPTSLPTPMFDGYGYEPEMNVIRTEMEGGAARARRRFTAVVTRFSFKLAFTQYEMDTFEAWITHEAKDGAEWFTMSVLTGRGIVSVDARLREPFKATVTDDGAFNVDLAVEVRNRPVMTPAQLAPRL